MHYSELCCLVVYMDENICSSVEFRSSLVSNEKLETDKKSLWGRTGQKE